MFGFKSVISHLLREITCLREELAAERTARGFAMQRMAELKLEHAKETEELRRRLAISQANFEWLSVSHNTLTMERAQIMLAKTGISFPAPQVEVRVPPSGMPEARELVDRPARDDLASLSAQGLSFEDVGTRAARALDLDDGEVYAGPTALLRQ